MQAAQIQLLPRDLLLPRNLMLPTELLLPRGLGVAQRMGAWRCVAHKFSKARRFVAAQRILVVQRFVAAQQHQRCTYLVIFMSYSRGEPHATIVFAHLLHILPLQQTGDQPLQEKGS